MHLELYDSLRFFTVFLFLLVAFFLLRQTNGRIMSHGIFSMFLFAPALFYRESNDNLIENQKSPVVTRVVAKDKQNDMRKNVQKNDTSEKENIHIKNRIQEGYLDKLLLYMETEKPYLNPNLSINDVSENTSIPAYMLSQVINSRLGKNFFNFINGYRIDASKKLLKDKGNAERSILDILYECGFNSKSSFNKAFKSLTGMTPSQFKRLA
ncbi:MAG: AraC family transcriptional regulator [bacterium]|nr:AraC family transcriptional regulator [bacterium]